MIQAYRKLRINRQTGFGNIPFVSRHLEKILERRGLTRVEGSGAGAHGKLSKKSTARARSQGMPILNSLWFAILSGDEYRAYKSIHHRSVDITELAVRGCWFGTYSHIARKGEL